MNGEIKYCTTNNIERTCTLDPKMVHHHHQKKKSAATSRLIILPMVRS